MRATFDVDRLKNFADDTVFVAGTKFTENKFLRCSDKQSIIKKEKYKKGRNCSFFEKPTIIKKKTYSS